MARSKGQGSIKIRKDGFYEGRITKNGITKYFYSKNKKDVEKRMSDYSKAGVFEKTVREKLQDYVYTYLITFKYGHIKASSYDRLEKIYETHIVDSSIGLLPLFELDDVNVQQFFNVFPMSGLSYSTAKKVYDLIRVVLSYAYIKNDISVDIASIVKLPPQEYFKEIKHVETYTQQEIDKIQEYIVEAYNDKKNKRFLRYAPSYMILFNTGLRAGEFLALTWNDIDIEKRVIHVSKSLSMVRDRNGGDTKYKSVITSVKTSAGNRDVPINRMCMFFIDDLKNRYNDFDCLCNYVCCNLDNEYIKLRSFERRFEDICLRVGVPYKGIHAIRHTFASNLIDKGAPAKVVSDLLGHSNVVFTLNRYVHTDEKQKISAINLL